MLAEQVIPEEMVYQRPESLDDFATHYCPGCTHGVAHRLIAEVIDEMGIREKTIGVAPVGCSVFAYNYFDCDFVEAAARARPGHGHRHQARAAGPQSSSPTRATAIWLPLAWPRSSTPPARGENITVIFINNAIYRHDRRADGPHHPARAEDDLIALGQGCGIDGLPDPRLRKLLSTLDGAAYVVRRSPARPQEHPHGQEGHPHGL